MKRNLQFLIFNFGLFLIILQTSNAWFFWDVSPIILILIYALTLLSGIWIFKKLECEKIKQNYASAAVLLLVLSVIWRSNITILGVGYIAFYYTIIWIIISLPDLEKSQILYFQTKFLAFIISISLLAWIIHFFYPVPSFGLIQRQGYESLYSNSFLYIAKYKYEIDIRFSSIFLEPGHLGTILALFLMANKFDYRKKEVKVFTLALLFSLSLAGYVLWVIGQLLIVFSQDRISNFLRKMLLSLFLFYGFYIVIINYDGGNNYINNRVLSRLETDESEYEYGGDRTTDDMKFMFNRAISDGTILVGMPNNKYSKIAADSSAGIVRYLIQKGIIGAVLMFGGYFVIARGSCNRKWAMLLFLYYVISSYQRTYFYWASYLIPFICGIVRKQNIIPNSKIQR